MTVRIAFGIKKIQGIIGLIRPFTLLAPFIVSFSIIMASFVYSRESLLMIPFFIPYILIASFSFVLLNAGSNALNQATDIKADCISKPYRPIPLGILTSKEALIIACMFYGFSFFLGFFINSMFVFFLALITFFTITYSLFPRMKDRLWWNQLWIGLPRGFLAILGSWCVFSSIVDPLPLIIASISGLFLFGGSITKDISDKHADKIVGTNTLITRYGEQKAACIILPFLFFPFLLIPLFIKIQLLPNLFWVLTFLAIPAFFIFKSMISKQSNTYRFENTVAWSFMYITYFIFSLSFSVLTVASALL